MNKKLVKIMAPILALLLAGSIGLAVAGNKKSKAPEETAAQTETSGQETAAAEETTAAPETEPIVLDPDRQAMDMEHLDLEILDVVENMRTGKFKEVENLFSETLLTMLNADSLKEAWDGVVKDLGQFKEYGDAVVEDGENGTRVASLISKYENKNLRTQLNITADGHIDGVWFFIEDPADEEGPKLSESELREKGKEYFRMMRTGEFAALTESFTSGLKSGLSASALRTAWSETTANLGKYKQVNSVDVTKADNGNYEVAVHAAFQESGLRTVFVCYPNGKIDGIWFYFEEDESQKKSESELEDLMRKHFDMMRSGDFSGVFSDFTMGLKGMLSAAQLRDAWNGQVAPLGKFEKVTGVSTIKNGDGMYEVSLTSSWEGDGLKTTFIYSPAGKVDGIWFYYEPKGDEKELSVSELKELLKDHFNMMRNNKFSSVYNDFTTGLKQGLSAAQLKDAWDGVVAPLGKFGKVESLSSVKNDSGLYEVSILSYWEESALKTTFIYTPAGRVDGIWFYYEDLPSSGDEKEVTTAELEAMMQKHFQMMQKDQFEDIFNDFSVALKGMLSANALRAAWDEEIAPLGAFGKVESIATTKQDDGNYCVELISSWKNDGLSTRYIYTPKGKVDGIWFDYVENPGSGEDPEEPEEPVTFTLEDAIALTEKHVENMRNGQSALVFPDFTRGLKNGLSAGQLQDAWNGSIANLGAFVKHQKGTGIVNSAGNYEVTVVSEFKVNGLGTTFVILPSGEIDGIWFNIVQLNEEEVAKYVELVRTARENLVAGKFADVAANFGDNLLNGGFDANALQRSWVNEAIPNIGDTFVKNVSDTAVRTSETSVEAADISIFNKLALKLVLVYDQNDKITSVMYYWMNPADVDPEYEPEEPPVDPPVDPPVEPEKITEAEAIALTEKHVKNMRENNSAAVIEDLSAGLQGGLSAAQLQAAWDNSIAGLGSFVKDRSGSARAGEDGSFEVDVVSEFSANGLKTTFVILPDGSIDGIWFNLVQLDVEAVAEYAELVRAAREKMVARQYADVAADFADNLLNVGFDAERLGASWENEALPNIGDTFVKHVSHSAIRISENEVEATDVSIFSKLALKFVLYYNNDKQITNVMYYWMNPEDVEVPEEVLTDEKAQIIVKTAMDKMAAGAFTDLHDNMFSGGLSNNLSAAAIEEAWNSMVKAASSGINAEIADYGTLLTEEISVNMDDLTGIVKQTYETGHLWTKIQLTAAGKVDGIWFDRTFISADEYAAKVAGYVNSMLAGDFAAVAADFTPELTAVFGEADLKNAWESWNLGALKAHESTNVAFSADEGNSAYGYAFRVTTVDMYENSGMRLMFTMTPDGRISNLNNWTVARVLTAQEFVDEMIDLLQKENYAELNARLNNGFDFESYLETYLYQTRDSLSENDRTITEFTRTYVNFQPTIVELDAKMSDGSSYTLKFQYTEDNLHLAGFNFWRNASAEELIAESRQFMELAQADQYEWWDQRFLGSYDLRTDFNTNMFNGRELASFDAGNVINFSDCIRADVTYTFTDGHQYVFHFCYDFNGINLMNLWLEQLA